MHEPPGLFHVGGGEGSGAPPPSDIGPPLGTPSMMQLPGPTGPPPPAQPGPPQMIQPQIMSPGGLGGGGPTGAATAGAVSINEVEVAEVLVALMQRQPPFFPQVPHPEEFIDSVAKANVLFGWNFVMESIGKILSTRHVEFVDETWLVLLRAWQRIALHLERTSRFATATDYERHEELMRPLPLSEELLPKDRRMFPLSVLPAPPDNRTLTSLSKFLVDHDCQHGSSLITQALLDSPPTQALFEVVHNLFYNQQERVYERHSFTLVSFISLRLRTRDAALFFRKLAEFLQGKLANVMSLYVAAHQGLNPYSLVEGKQNLILDPSRTMQYFQAVFGVCDALKDTVSEFAQVLKAPRLMQDFDRLRDMACRFYPEEAQRAGLDRKSYMIYVPQALPAAVPLAGSGSANTSGVFFGPQQQQAQQQGQQLPSSVQLQQQPLPAHQPPPATAGIPRLPPGAAAGGWAQQLTATAAAMQQAQQTAAVQVKFQQQQQQKMQALIRPDPQNISEDYYFGLFYSREIDAKQLVEIMQQLAAHENNTPEAELLARMLRTLFQECRHLPRYPPPELQRTAVFFGRLIRSQLLLKKPELQWLAIRCVLEALRKGPETNICRFGLAALQQFLSVAPNSPTLLGAIIDLRFMRENFPELVSWAEACLNAMPQATRAMHLVDQGDTMSLPARSIPPPEGCLTIPMHLRLVPAPPTEGGNSTVEGANHITPPQQLTVKLKQFGLGQVEALMDDPDITRQIIVPPESTRNRVAQVFNAMVMSNVQQKAADVANMLSSDYYPWLAFYIVKTRASKELNHQDLYARFSDLLPFARMNELLVNITYDCINALLKYVDAAKEVSCYRQVLKALGSWLGLLTLARNKPVRGQRYDIKSFLFEAYERGYLIVMVPLTCATLGHVAHSRMFKLPNPWTEGCLVCLGYLYRVPNIKQTLCFEIELLMGNLNLELTGFFRPGPNPFTQLGLPPVDSPDFQPPKSKTGDNEGSPTGIAEDIPAVVGPVTSAASTENLRPIQPGPLRPQPQYQPSQPTAQSPTEGAGPGQQTSQLQSLQQPQSQSLLSGTQAGTTAASAAPPTNPNDPNAAVSAVLAVAAAQRFQLQQQQHLATTAGVGRVATQVTGMPSNGTATAAPGQASTQAAGTPWPTTDQRTLGEPGGQLLQVLAENVQIATPLTIFQQRQELRAAVPIALERAIRELVGAISDRAVALAVGTTIEIVLKDFHLESDETLVKRAAQLMAASLGGSIVTVTGRSPLRMGIVQHLKDLFQRMDTDNSQNDEFVDQTAQILANDNLRMASALIERVVLEQAIHAMQSALQRALVHRRSGTPGVLLPDSNFQPPKSNWPAALPKCLQVTSNLESHQVQVYQHFCNVGPLKRMQEAAAGNQGGSHIMAAACAPPENPVISAGVGQTGDLPEGPSRTNAAFVTANANDTSSLPNATRPLSSMPIAQFHISPQRNLTTEEALAGIDIAVGNLKEGVKELAYSPAIRAPSLLRQHATDGSDRSGTNQRTPLPNSLGPVVAAPPCSFRALEVLAQIPTDHEVFVQLETVVRLLQNCDDKENVAGATARRLLRSIYDAAMRGMYPSSDEVDISLIFLEAFVALLKRFDEEQMVHYLRSVIAKWLIGITFLSASNNKQHHASNDNNSTNATSAVAAAVATSPQRNFADMTIEVLHYALLVGSTFARYRLVDLELIDVDFISGLLQQVYEGLDTLITTNSVEQARLVIEMALHFAATTCFGPSESPAVMAAGVVGKQGSSDSLAADVSRLPSATHMPKTCECLQKLAEAIKANVHDSQQLLGEARLTYPAGGLLSPPNNGAVSVDGISAQRVSSTLGEALTFVLGKLEEPPSMATRCMTIQDILRYKQIMACGSSRRATASGDLPIASAIPPPPPSSGELRSLSTNAFIHAFESGKVQPGAGTEAVLAYCVEAICGSQL